jgi:hypothetical protein
MILLLIGGLQYMTSAGNEEASAKAKRLILEAIIGLVIVLAAWAAGNWIIDRLTGQTNVITIEPTPTPPNGGAGGGGGTTNGNQGGGIGDISGTYIGQSIQKPPATDQEIERFRRNCLNGNPPGEVIEEIPGRVVIYRCVEIR